MASGYLALLRSLAEPAEKERVRLAVQIWAEALRAPQIHAVAREGVDAPRAVVTTLIRAAQDRGDLPAMLPPDGLTPGLRLHLPGTGPADRVGRRARQRRLRPGRRGAHR